MTIRSLVKIGVSLMLGVASAALGRGQNVAELKVGDDAPGFSLQGSDGRRHTLAEFKGKKAVVVAWFPKAFTGG